MPNETNLPTGINTSSLMADANITDEVNRSSIALGDLMLHTGNGIAETQNKLNATSARTATALANTMVDVIAVEEKIYDDNGNYTETKNYKRQLPLINFIDPVFYEWSRVRIQGVFQATEFKSEQSATKSTYRSKSDSSQSGLFVILGGGSTGIKYSSTDTESESEYSYDKSVGRVRMNSLLEPKKDVTVPKPKQVIRGPRLSITQGEIIDVNDGTRVTGRTMSILIQYNKIDGSPIAGKAISIETGGLPWSFTGDSTTDTSGNLEILLSRDFPDEDSDTTPQSTTISARIGLVQNNTAVTL